jgi:hypothetical protein
MSTDATPGEAPAAPAVANEAALGAALAAPSDASAIAAATAAFERFRDALSAARDPARLRAAVVDEIRIDRHVPGPRGSAPLAETFAGIAEVERWFARSPAAVQFSLAGSARVDEGDVAEGAPARWSIEYAYDAADFHNGGIWTSRFAGDGRIASLSHHPFALRDDPPASPGTPHAHGGSGHSHGDVPHAHGSHGSHGHGHGGSGPSHGG